MSTRSTISIQRDDGTIDSIYCHHDGYPEGNGKILLKHYDTEEKVKDLISLGDISFLGPTTTEGDTRSYHQWKGDPIRILNSQSPKQIDKQEYNYLWKDDMWWMSETDDEWVPLDQIIMETKEEKFYPAINEETVNEIYDPDWVFIKAEDSLPTYTKKNFQDVIRDIQRRLTIENFTEVEIEDYLKRVIEDIVQ